MADSLSSKVLILSSSMLITIPLAVLITRTRGRISRPLFSRRSAAYELALASGREYRQGDQIAFYVTGTKKKVSVTDNAKRLADADESVRDENVEYYLDKLSELRKKFEPYLPPARPDAQQEEFKLEF